MNLIVKRIHAFVLPVSVGCLDFWGSFAYYDYRKAGESYYEENG